MTKQDIQAEIEYYELMLVERPEDKEVWEEELRKLRKYEK